MKLYEKIIIDNTNKLKQPTIFFFLKNNGFSEHYIKNLRNTQNSILLNGTPVIIREKIKDGDILEIAKNPNRGTDIFLCDGKLEILFEDDDYLIVNKPHNLACTPTRSHFSMNLGGQICKYMNEKDENFMLRILNRLDRETAGIVVIAKNVLAYNSMKDLHKEYHAICHGNLDENITINTPILTVTNNGINEIKRIISPLGKSAITHVEVIKNIQNLCLIKLTLETGRTHQIRVHMSSIDHPLVDDTIYGIEKDHIDNSHAMLLLKKISFTHFRTNERITLEVDYPNDWSKHLNDKI